jgi:putative Mg2+ transporter-C (MgtC) family protein
MNSTGTLGPVLPHLPDTWKLCLRLLLAAALGALIGIEREISDHPSGVRTHITVAIGAALFGICSAYAWGDFVALRNDNNWQLDPTRIASQVVVGVGFLGGGAIIKQGNTVRGLTSAAGLWVSAAVGLATALGMWREALAATVILVIALILLKTPRRWLRNRLRTRKATVLVTLDIATDPSGVVTAIGALAGTVIHSLVVKKHADDGTITIEADIEARSGALDGRMAAIESRDDVLSVEFS